MTRSDPSRLAALLLRFVASEQDALAGDLVEEWRSGRSRSWFWWQLLRAVGFACAAKRKPAPAILALADLSIEGRRVPAFGLLDPAPMQLSGRRLRGVGGSGLLGTTLLITLVLPQAWFLVLFSLAGGVVIGIMLVRRRRDGGLSGPIGQSPLTLFPTTGAPQPRHARTCHGHINAERLVAV